MSAEPIDAMFRLETLASELDRRSNELAETERKLDPIEAAYDEFVSDYEASLYDESLKEGGPRLPGESIRLALAHREMPPSLRGEHRTLTGKRRRLEKRISTLKTEVEAQRSILSALKVQAEADGAGLRSAA